MQAGKGQRKHTEVTPAQFCRHTTSSIGFLNFEVREHTCAREIEGTKASDKERRVENVQLGRRMLHEFRHHDGWRIDHGRLQRVGDCTDSCGEIGMHVNESMPVQRHAVALFGGCVLLCCRFLAMAGVTAVLLCAGEHEELRAGYAAAAQKCC